MKVITPRRPGLLPRTIMGGARPLRPALPACSSTGALRRRLSMVPETDVGLVEQPAPAVREQRFGLVGRSMIDKAGERIRQGGARMA